MCALLHVQYLCPNSSLHHLKCFAKFFLFILKTVRACSPGGTHRLWVQEQLRGGRGGVPGAWLRSCWGGLEPVRGAPVQLSPPWSLRGSEPHGAALSLKGRRVQRSREKRPITARGRVPLEATSANRRGGVGKSNRTAAVIGCPSFFLSRSSECFCWSVELGRCKVSPWNAIVSLSVAPSRLKIQESRIYGSRADSSCAANV